MRFIAPREALLPPLQQVVGAIAKRQTLPILSHVLLRLADGRLEMVGTDLEVQLADRAVVEDGEPGEITVPARKLLDIVRLLPAGAAVALEGRPASCTVRSGRSRFQLATLPAETFPAFDADEPDLTLEVPAAPLRMALAKTAHAMADGDARYYLNGLLLEVGAGWVRAVSSDGHRLALCDPDSDSADEVRAILVPRRAVLELARLLGDGMETVTLRVAPHALQVALGSVDFAAKLIEGRFPDYRRILPRDLTRSFEADTAAFRAALSRVALLSDEKHKTLRLEVDGDSLTLKAILGHEEAEEDLPVELTGNGMSVGFNAVYLLDALDQVDSGRVKLSFPDGLTSCLVADAEDGRFRFVVMPVRL